MDSANPRASAFDLIAHPELGGVRGRPYVERRRLMLELLEDAVTSEDARHDH
ncbi:hypothetical protein ACFWCB_05750 [Streptomyces sp. NPDC060048]|uniref:hypothetical protein n=1 Tax=unclassified Streptomyces TaxID=2593676 RepID=UPI0036A5ADDA